MRTTTSLSLADAAKRTGKSKPTILRAIQGGKISAQKDEHGEWQIEPAELFRVYPSAPDETDEPVHETGDETSRTTSGEARNGLIPGDTRTGTRTVAELEAMKRELEQEREERARERRQLEETVGDLRRRLDASEEERRQKDTQLTHLLTDQREKAVTPPEKPQGLITRLLGGLKG